jgi:hypothetical protein
MTNKRGQIPWKIIGVILAVAVLAIFIYALATGTNPLFGGIDSFGGGQVNVQQTVQSCQQACLTQSVFDYCGKVREVVFQKGESKVPGTCRGLETAGVGLVPCTALNAELCAAANGKALTKIQQDALAELGRDQTRDQINAQAAVNVAEQEFNAAAEEDKAAAQIKLDDAKAALLAAS